MIEQPPYNTDLKLSSYLLRVLGMLERNIKLVEKIQPRTALPSRPEVGKIYYFSSTVLPTITAEGYWGYKSTGWVQLG